MIVAQRVVYSGRVQGVGFRFTAQRLANGLPIVGTVRNCADGSVELFVQGEGGDVEAFLNAVGREMQDFIAEQKVEELAPRAMQGFHIVR
jgi:acylphosphatase